VAGDELRPGFIVVTSALNRDHDGDSVPDGAERDLGANPTDPLDGDDFQDSDLDGLTDAEELWGWGMWVWQNAAWSYREVASNPNLPDSDFDGLPDFLERDIRSDPNQTDTDGDTLLDFDEFSDFESYAEFTTRFPGFVLSSTGSMQYGTSVIRTDTDGDTLTDDFELLTGYRILVPSESSVRHILTDPLFGDTDLDSRWDNVELLAGTDATDPDTDDDGRTDDVEFFRNTNPLVPDIRVTARYQLLEFGTPGADLFWAWKLRATTGGNFPGGAVGTQKTFHAYSDFGDNALYPLCGTLQFGGESFIPLEPNAYGRFNLRPGEGFSLSGSVQQVLNCPDFEEFSLVNCDMTFDKFFTFEQVSGLGFIGDKFILTGDNSCAADVFYEIIID